MPEVGIEVALPTKQHFHIVRETLKRIGMPGGSSDFPTLYQSAHILHRKGRYYIVHFKEIFLLDGLPSTFNEQDNIRRDTIVDLLLQWNLVDLVGEPEMYDPDYHLVRVLKKDESAQWNLVPKYTIRGKQKPREAFDESYFDPDNSPPKPGNETWVGKVVNSLSKR